MSDEIKGTVGDEGKNIVVGKDINQDVREAQSVGNVLQVNLTPERWVEAIRSGELTMAEADRLQQQINDALKLIGELKGTVGEVRGAFGEMKGTVTNLGSVLAAEAQESRSRSLRSDERVNRLTETVDKLAAAVTEASKEIERRNKEQRTQVDPQTNRNITIIGALIILLLILIVYGILFRNQPIAYFPPVVGLISQLIK